jgi:hypothetical protein
MPAQADPTLDRIVDRLVDLYDRPFGGKPRGRFRISMKLMGRLFRQRRVWPDQVEALRRALYDRGFLLVDLGTYFVVVSEQTFASYRRVNEEGIAAPGQSRASRTAGTTDA